MDPSWVMALDNLAAGGVIDFDAASYILDKPARYVGHPGMESLPLGNIEYLPKGTKLKDVPKIDVFERPEDGDFIHNPTWKKALVGTILGAGVGLLGLKFLGKFVKLPFKLPKIGGFSFSKIKLPKIKSPKIKMPKLTNLGTNLKNFSSKITKYIKKPISFMSSKFKKIRK